MEQSQITLEGRCVLVTGAAGFVGYHLCRRLLHEVPGIRLVGVDNLSPYYDVRLKDWRLQELGTVSRDREASWTLCRGSIADRSFLEAVFERFRPSLVIHLAAQAGVRHSVTHPEDYMESNLMGIFRVLEACRHHGVEHLVYASSSSVYGRQDKRPYSEDDRTDFPVSLYAATKKGGELLAHSYSSLYGIPMTGVRLFTVYGPAGRPDMAYFSFAETWRGGGRIRLFDGGLGERDYTYIDDAVEGLVRLLVRPPRGETPCRIVNLGGGHPVQLRVFVERLHDALLRHGCLPAAHALWESVEFTERACGDVLVTDADWRALQGLTGFRPGISLTEGLDCFARWYGAVWLGELLRGSR